MEVTMAEGAVENSIRIADVDVDESMKENVSQCELSCDSGADTLDTASISCPSTSDSDLSPTKYSASPICNGGDNTVDVLSPYKESSHTKSTSELSSSKHKNGIPLADESQYQNHHTNISTASSLESKPTNENQNVELQNRLTDIHSSENPSLLPIQDNLLPKCTTPSSDTNTKEVNMNKQDIVVDNLLGSSTDSEREATTPVSSANSLIASKSENQILEAEFCITNKNLTMSTTSLNDEIPPNNISNCKSQSRSVENMATIEDNVTSSLSSSTKDLDTDQILSEFTNQKNKVKATQKIVNDTPQATINPDLKYARIPKEILSQDLGSIAKSVHGIFSSVSGSLKNAYNNSQKVTAVKLPIKNITKPIHGKVMNDIFEDNVPETNVASVAENICIEKEKLELGLNVDENVSLDVGSDDETKKDLLKLQIESLERLLAEQRRDNTSLRERVKQQADELQAKDQAFKELEAKVDLMCKRAEQALREKDAAVMRYASAECAGIEARRAGDAARAAAAAAAAERELMAGKLRSARDDRERICRLYDDKCHELKNCELELGRAREEARELDGRLKWTQSKLRMEVDAYKESSERAERLAQQVGELAAARDAAAAAASAADCANAKHLEGELKQSQAALILCRHEKEELERRCAGTAQQLDCCRRERDDASDALARATAEVERLKESNLRLEEEAAELAALRAQAALADTLSSQLQRETERASQVEEALTRERARAETCARREAAALEHAARLTAQHVAQRAAAADADAKAAALGADNAALRERARALEAEGERLRAALAAEAGRRAGENHLLARRVRMPRTVQAAALGADDAALRERARALEAEGERLRAALAAEAGRRAGENHLLARRVRMPRTVQAAALGADDAALRERARALEAEGERLRAALAAEAGRRAGESHLLARRVRMPRTVQAAALGADDAALRERARALEAEGERLRAALAAEAGRRAGESHLLARRVAELTEEAGEARKQLEWEQGENAVLKKKHASAVKELNREVARATKRAEQLEARLAQPATGAPSTRTGSITSLSSMESGQEERLHNGHSEPLPDVQASGPVPERQALIERIVQLQRAAARRAERCDFLEEHARALTAELRGKSRLLRRLLPALPAGALAPQRSDDHKKEIAKLGGGAMAALWGGDGEGMTLELALEVARRLQALLEDTLLKNITLKENIDTLGEEIARLRKQVNGEAESKQ